MKEDNNGCFFIIIIVLLWLILMHVSISDVKKDASQPEKTVQQVEVEK